MNLSELFALSRSQVHRHPGSFEEYGGRLAAAAPGLLQAACGPAGARAAAAAAPAGPTPEPSRGATAAPAAAGALPWPPAGCVSRCAVVRGCALLLAWARGLRAEAQGATGEGGGWVADVDRQAQQFQGMVASQLAQLVPGAADGAGEAVGGVAVQLGAGSGSGCGEGTQAQVWEEDSLRGGPARVGSSRRPAVRLLSAHPPAFATGPQQQQQAAGPVRLLLHSPQPQAVRVLVLAEPGSGSSDSWGAEARVEVPRAQLLQEVRVNLRGGMQEVEVGLDPAALAAAAAATGPATSDTAAAATCAGAGVGILQLVVVGPEHGAREAGNGVDGGGVGGAAAAAAAQPSQAPQPLVHCVAPPLLLLPAPAAAEVCDLWEAMQQEHQRQQAAEGQQGEARAGQPQEMATGQAEAEAGARSGVWWSHLAPLLCDVGYALAAMQQQVGARNEARVVVDHMLPYLYDNGMVATAELLRDLQAAESIPSPPPAVTCRITLEDSIHTSASLTADCALTPAAAAALEGAADGGSVLPVQPRPSLLRSFSPAPLESAFQAWRLQGLATNAPYVLALSLYMAAMVVARGLLAAAAGGGAAVPGAAAGGEVGAGAGARHGGAQAGAGHLPTTAAVSLVSGLADVVGLVALRVVLAMGRGRGRGAARGRRNQVQTCKQQQAEEEQVQQWGKGEERQESVTAAGGSGSGSGIVAYGGGESDSGDVDVEAAPRVYRIASCVAGPSLFLLNSALAFLGVTPLDGRYVGDQRVLYGSLLKRGLLAPSLQQLGAAEAAAAALLLGPGEALWLRRLQPAWSWVGVGALVVALRALAVAVSAGWEWRARGRFVRQMAGGRAAGKRGGCVEQRGGAGVGSGCGAARVAHKCKEL